jgi:FlaA1/EpsC-like NDP-sugar epimerase
LSEHSELYVLEMGEPVKIVDLAHKMITLTGADTKIEFTGLRPAEKLHEALVTGGEELSPSGREKILVVNALPVGGAGFEAAVDEMIERAEAHDAEAVRELLERAV